MHPCVAQSDTSREAVTVDVLDSLDVLRSRDADWLSLCRHPEAHPATFEAVCRANVNLIRPHVVLVHRGGDVVGLAVARIQSETVPVRFGLGTPLSPRLRVIRVSYDGVSGDGDPDVHGHLMNALSAPLLTGAADALYFDHARDGSAVHAWATKPPAPLRRDLAPVRQATHWTVDVSGCFKAYLKGLSKSQRGDFNQSRNRMSREFGERYAVACYRSVDDYDTVERDTSRIAALSYHKALGVSFVDRFWSRPLFMSGLEAGLARCYISYVDGRPVAFYHGLAWRGTFCGSMTGYDPAFSAVSVGRHLVQHVVEDLSADPNISLFDLGVGHAIYKSRIGTSSCTEIDRYVFAPRVRPSAINALRGTIEGAARVSDASITALGLRSIVKSAWWRRTTAK